MVIKCFFIIMDKNWLQIILLFSKIFKVINNDNNINRKLIIMINIYFLISIFYHLLIFKILITNWNLYKKYSFITISFNINNIKKQTIEFDFWYFFLNYFFNFFEQNDFNLNLFYVFCNLFFKIKVFIKKLFLVSLQD